MSIWVYLGEWIREFFEYLGLWLKTRWATPWVYFVQSFKTYHETLLSNMGDFQVIDWILLVIFWIFLLALLVGFVWLLVWLIRKYVKFYRSELDKEKLKSQIADLQLELYRLTMEKQKILDMNIEQMGLEKPDEEEGEEENADQALANARFQMLMTVDRHYLNGVEECEFKNEEDASINLEQLCERFRNFACSQMHLYYTLPTIRALFAAMGASHLIILEGISGTGKTSLPYALGRFFEHNCVICPVQPSWRDRTELIGFYNEFTHKFTETEFLRAMYEATWRKDINYIVLDEMNLARIEYYFAELLSILEVPNPEEWNLNIIASSRSDDPKHLNEGYLKIPTNIWFVGTANNDDSTFTITDKVYDRAMSIFFDNKGIEFPAPFTDSMKMPAAYLQKLFTDAIDKYRVSQETLDKFADLDTFVIANFRLAFGNRIMKQISMFVPCYVACGGTELEGMDYIFESKILKKFEVLNVGFLKDELVALDAKLTELFGDGEFIKSKAKIKRLLKQGM